MVVGTLQVQIYMQGVNSLKEKRSIVKSVIGRLKSRFNISVAEVGHNDNKQTALIGISVVSNETRFVCQQFDKIIEFMKNDHRFYLGSVERETF